MSMASVQRPNLLFSIPGGMAALASRLAQSSGCDCHLGLTVLGRGGKVAF